MNILRVAAVAALDVEFCGLGGHDGGTDDDTGYSYELGDGERVEVANRGDLGARVEEELVVREVDLGLVRVDDSVGASFQGGLEL